MAAPRFAPSPVVDTVRGYHSPAVAPAAWTPNRPGAVVGFQPVGPQLGYQGPDQGFALTIAHAMGDRLQLGPGEHRDDAVRGSVAIGLRRASMFSRAPVVHDLIVAFTIWGWLDASPPADLRAERADRFAGLGHDQHYVERRALVDMVPAETLRMSPQQVAAAYPGRWRALVGL